MSPLNYFRSPTLPDGFFLETNSIPSAQAINRLLSSCNSDTHNPGKLALALKNSYCNLSVKEEKNDKLYGFVRITSDKGLNANLWDLAAYPGKFQKQCLAVLVNQSLALIRRNLPGCSVSIAAPPIALHALEGEGFLLDPGGIRTMAIRL